MKSRKKNFFLQHLEKCTLAEKKSPKFRDPYKSLVPFDPAQTQTCHAKNDANVQAPDVTMIKDGIVPSEAEQTTDDDDTSIISTTISSQQMDFRYTMPKLNKKKEEAEKTSETSVIFTTTSGQLMDFRSYKIPKLIKMEEDVRSL